MSNKKQTTIDLCAPFMVTPNGGKEDSKRKKRQQMTLTPLSVETYVEDAPKKKTRFDSSKAPVSPDNVVNLLDEGFPAAGDLVEMVHPDKKDYLVFGIVQNTTTYKQEDKVFEEHVEVKWQEKSRDGELNAVIMPELSTVSPQQLHVIARKEEPFHLEKFNWWKVAAVDRDFEFDEDRRMWIFKKCMI